MNPIDLTDYAHAQDKIPMQLLGVKEAVKPIPTWKILVAHGMDFYSVIIGASLFSTFYSVGMGSLIVTSSLREAHAQINYLNPYSFTLPAMIFGYFFFSYFLNDGQTLSQKHLKMRINMERMSFKTSLVWATFSTSLILSCGLTLLVAKKWMSEEKLGTFEAHDHLYHQLMANRSLSPMNLLEKCFPETASSEEAVEPSYQKAA